MSYKLEIRPLATIEIIEAYDWHEMRRAGLGIEFLLELEKFYTTLLLNPDSYSYFEKPVRQGVINRFPYTVVYEVFNQNIVIYSVFMFRQDPDKKRTG